MILHYFKKKTQKTPKREIEQAIEFEKELIYTMLQIREKQGLTQAKIAELCGVKQPMIARMEKTIHSPRLDSILKVLVQLGYTLQIIPIEKKDSKLMKP